MPVNGVSLGRMPTRACTRHRLFELRSAQPY
jgi:hypothetical protein